RRVRQVDAARARRSAGRPRAAATRPAAPVWSCPNPAAPSAAARCAYAAPAAPPAARRRSAGALAAVQSRRLVAVLVVALAHDNERRPSIASARIDLLTCAID